MNVSDPKHPHHAVWREHVLSVLAGAPKDVEFKLDKDLWTKLTYESDGFASTNWHTHSEYRITKPMITRTISYPAPMTVAPEVGTTYFSICSGHPTRVTSYDWDRSACSQRFLQRGLCWATEADAIEAAKAIFGGEA